MTAPLPAHDDLSSPARTRATTRRCTPDRRPRSSRRPRAGTASANERVAAHDGDLEEPAHHRRRRRRRRYSPPSGCCLGLAMLLLSAACPRHHSTARANVWGRSHHPSRGNAVPPPKLHLLLARLNRGGANEQNEAEEAAASTAPDRKPPPPPPPPPPPRFPPDGADGEERDSTTARATPMDARGPPPPPPLASDAAASNVDRRERIPPPPPYSQMQEDPPVPPPTSYGAGGWYAPEEGTYVDDSSSWIPMDPRMYPPPPQYDPQQQQQQEYYDRHDRSGSSTDQYPAYGDAVVEELARERDELLLRAQNLTETLQELERREALRVRQIDLLTERTMAADAEHARDRLLLSECQSNCTQLQVQVNELMQDVERQKRQREEMEEQSGIDAKRISGLKKELEASQLKAEELAFMIERHRIRSISENGDDDDDEDSVYRGRRSSRKAKKKIGFWAWLFGWGSGDDESSNSEYDGPNLDDVYTTARSTLLSALQSERSSVHELETIVASLQQNNSAISEQVKSRDQVIDELNDRILVFEEDKLVLKAALKQLQKDLSAEAPRTEKLVQDLDAAQTEVKRLKKEIKGLIRTHQEEVAALRETISVKEDSIAMTESNLTVIGTYVDRLESRLAEFALARRDIEVREAKCREIEVGAEATEKARSELQAKVKEMESEHVELRALLRELADERAKLLAKNQDLESEVKTLKAHDARVQESLAKLNSDYGELVVADMALQHKLDTYEKEALESTGAATTLNERLASSERQVEELRQQVESEKSQQQAVLKLLQQAEATSKQMKERLEQLQAMNIALSENNTRIQKEANETLSSRRPATVGRDELSIHLADLKSHTPRFVGTVSGSSVRDLVPVLLERPRTRVQRQEDRSLDELRTEASLKNASKPVIPAVFQRPSDANASTAERSPPTRIQIPTLPDKSQPAVVPAKPFRYVRKAFAKATGIHGAFSKDHKNQSTKPLQRIPTRASATDPRRTTPELVQNPLRRPPQPGVPSGRQSGRTKDPVVRLGDAATTAAHNASQTANTTAKKSEPPSSLLKPGLPAFGRKEGASVPPGRCEAPADASPSAVPLPPVSPAPPPLSPKLERTSERSEAATSLLPSPGRKVPGTAPPQEEKRPDGDSSSRRNLPHASTAGPRQPLASKSHRPEHQQRQQQQQQQQQQGQPPPKEVELPQPQPPRRVDPGSRPPAGGQSPPPPRSGSIQSPPADPREPTNSSPFSPDKKS